ncbi:MAG: alcohol dehydrogenase catalytic domain-containing protein [Nitrososphaeria archaeon]
MQALLLYPNSEFKLEEVKEPIIGENPYAPNDTILEIKYCGICGSDLHYWKHRREVEGPKKPSIMGHEVSAIVKEVGANVKDFKPGDRVVGEIVTFYCGNCVNCKQGRINICCNIPVKEQRVHYTTGGGFARYAAWPAYSLHKLPDNIGELEAVLVETTAGCVHSLIERAQLVAGESILIIGPGPRGLILLQVAKAIGAWPIIVAGTSFDEEKRLPLAKELGADIVVNVDKEDLVKMVKDSTDGWGADVVVEAAGTGDAVLLGYKSVRPGGRMVVSGGGIVGGINVTLDTYDLITKEITILGEISHIWRSWETAIKLISTGRVKLKPLISHVFSLSEWQKAFDTAINCKHALRVVLKP